MIQNKKYFEYGDIVIGKIGHCKQTMGLAAAYLGTRKCIAGDAVFVLKHNQNPQFIAYMLSSKYCRKQIEIQGGGGAILNFSIKELRKIKIPLPSLEEQGRIVKTLDQMQSNLVELENNVQDLIEQREKQYNFYSEKLLSN